MKDLKNVVVSSKLVLNSMEMDLSSDPTDPQFSNILGPFGMLAFYGDIFGCYEWVGGELLMAFSQ